jgi:pyrimidine deaminase RibD-like protein
MSDRDLMLLAIKVARESKNEPGVKPFVGAVAVQDGIVLDTAARGEVDKGDHAEVGLLKKLSGHALSDTTIFTTLEPCTLRNSPNTPCVELLIERRIRRVVIGILDPHILICGQGYQRLRDMNIDVEFFEADLVRQIEELNRVFRKEHRKRSLFSAALKSSNETLIGDHFYTTDVSEFRNALNRFPYRFEDISCYVRPANDSLTEYVPFFRLWNESRWDHFYTIDSDERNRAIAEFGYTMESVACRVSPSAGLKTKPLRRFFHSQRHDHFYTIHPDEADVALRLGYVEEQIACHVSDQQAAGDIPLFRAVSLR